jgi:glycosyltransferase involved in cell wall biosynthesis
MERPPEQINSAGYVRNYGIKFATTEWVAFVDDDDTIRNTYVETFLREIATYDTDVIIFRMLKFDKAEISIKQVLEGVDANQVKIDEQTEELYRNMDHNAVVVATTITPFPDSGATDLKEHDVGISFSVKKQIFDSGIQFNTSHIEDYEFLETVRQNGYKMMISPYIMYFVRECRYFEDFEYNRLFINCQEPN